jgi:hypothetical protein
VLTEPLPSNVRISHNTLGTDEPSLCCDMFFDGLNSAVYTASSGHMINEQRIGRDEEGRGGSLIRGFIAALASRNYSKCKPCKISGGTHYSSWLRHYSTMRS